jgi:hypothetical protein
MALPELEFPPYEGVNGCNYPTNLETQGEDNTVTVEMQNGTVLVRPWSTKQRKTFTLEFNTRTIAEAKVLEDFYDLVNLYTPFTFTHPTDKDETNNFKQYAVRFNEPIDITQDGSRPFVKDISMKFTEI